METSREKEKGNWEFEGVGGERGKSLVYRTFSPEMKLECSKVLYLRNYKLIREGEGQHYN